MKNILIVRLGLRASVHLAHSRSPSWLGSGGRELEHMQQIFPDIRCRAVDPRSPPIANNKRKCCGLRPELTECDFAGTTGVTSGLPVIWKLPVSLRTS